MLCILILLFGPSNYNINLIISLSVIFFIFIYYKFKRIGFYYAATLFLLIGAFLSIEKSLWNILIFLIPYVLLIKEKVEFDFDEALVVAFSCLGFWIILIEFNYLEYIGLFLAITTALLIYFLNNIIEE